VKRVIETSRRSLFRDDVVVVDGFAFWISFAAACLTSPGCRFARVPTCRSAPNSSVVQKQSCFLVSRTLGGHFARALVGRHESFRQRAVQRPRRHDGQGGLHGGRERGTRRRTGTSRRTPRWGLFLHCFPRAVGTPRGSRPALPRLPATVDGAGPTFAPRARDAETTRVLESGAFPRASVRAAKRRFRLGARRRSSAFPTPESV
jgi:hypothetical protein